MSHELTQRENGQVEFAYAVADGEPWHGLGHPMQPGATVEEWRIAAGMEWAIKRSKVRYATSMDPTTPLIEVPEKHVLFRSDTHAPLGVVSDKYKTVQPAEVLDFFKDIARAGGLELSAAGTIFGGKRFWATAKIGEASPTGVNDKINGFLLISTSADGSLSTEVRRTTVRAVCNNTLSMALSKVNNGVKITHRSVFKPEDVHAFMGLNEAAWASFRHQIETLANTDLKLDAAEEAAVSVFGGDPDKVRTSAGFGKVMDLFANSGLGAKEDGVYGTAWGFVNAFTEYADHWTRARSAENRFVSSQWGSGAQLKDAAMAKALALAE
jgi:phage/plasmid-like protein (TIGR03299 family)